MSQPDLFGANTAEFSECRCWRYSLTRRWGAGKHVLFIGLNPSTADETENDPTIRRCIGFATGWGFDGLVMANLFAWRSTNPKALKAIADPVGPKNDQYLLELAGASSLVVLAWGADEAVGDRGDYVTGMLMLADVAPISVLRLTADGRPWHPLYLPKTLVPLDPTTLEPLDLEAIHAAS